MTSAVGHVIDRMNNGMALEHHQRQIILVLEDIEETAYLIEKMLKGNGYSVSLARTEEDAIFRGRSQSPDLILMSLGLGPERLLATAHRIRRQAGLSQDVAIVIFCIPTIPEGAEMEVDKNVYVTRPDNFNQLRELLHRLLCRVPSY
jgi:two-component system KDP operon response regulator KdpE